MSLGYKLINDERYLADIRIGDFLIYRVPKEPNALLQVMSETTTEFICRVLSYKYDFYSYNVAASVAEEAVRKEQLSINKSTIYSGAGTSNCILIREVYDQSDTPYWDHGIEVGNVIYAPDKVSRMSEWIPDRLRIQEVGISTIRTRSRNRGTTEEFSINDFNRSWFTDISRCEEMCSRREDLEPTFVPDSDKEKLALNAVKAIEEQIEHMIPDMCKFLPDVVFNDKGELHNAVKSYIKLNL